MVEEHTLEQENREDKTRLTKIIGTVFGVLIFVVLIIVKSQVESFSLFWVVGGGVVILALVIFIWVGFDWYKKFQDLKDSSKVPEGLPPAITLEQAEELIQEQLKSPKYYDYSLGWEQHKIGHYGRDGKTQVLLVHLGRTYYSSSDFTFYLMNMHDPRNRWSLIVQDKYNPGELVKEANRLAYSPMDEPDMKVTESENLLTGVKIKTTESKKEEKKKEEPKEDKEDLK